MGAKMKPRYLQVGSGLALGAGMAIAVAFILGSRGLWLALGLAIGVVIGDWMARASAKNRDQPQKSGLWTEKPQGTERP